MNASSDLRTMLLGIRQAKTSSEVSSARLVLADWLEEQGDNRAEEIRKHPKLELKVDWRDERLSGYAEKVGLAAVMAYIDGRGPLPEQTAEEKASATSYLEEQYRDELRDATLNHFPEVCICPEHDNHEDRKCPKGIAELRKMIDLVAEQIEQAMVGRVESTT